MKKHGERLSDLSGHFEMGGQQRSSSAIRGTGLWAIILVLAILAPAASSTADEVASLFAQGNQLYTSGDYRGAIRAYEAIIDKGYESWEVYYNLGNAYYKSGQLGRAILNFERALRLNPRNEDIRYNLELANLKVVDRIHSIPELFFVRWLKGLAQLLSAATLGWLSLGMYFLAILLWISRLFVAKVGWRSLSTLMLVPVVTAMLFFGGLAAYRVYLDRAINYAIVLAEKVDARSAPEPESTEVFAIHEGVKVRIEDRASDWAKIRLADGKVGWVPGTSIEKI